MRAGREEKNLGDSQRRSYDERQQPVPPSDTLSYIPRVVKDEINEC